MKSTEIAEDLEEELRDLYRSHEVVVVLLIVEKLYKNVAVLTHYDYESIRISFRMHVILKCINNH